MATTEGVLEYPVIGPFSGLSKIYSGEYLKEVESPDCLNVNFSNGEIVKRYGLSTFGTNQPLDDEVTGFYFAHKVGAFATDRSCLLASTGHSLYVYNRSQSGISMHVSASIDSWQLATDGSDIFTTGVLYVPSFSFFPTDTVVVTSQIMSPKKLTYGVGTNWPTVAALDVDSIFTEARSIVNFLGFAVAMDITESGVAYPQRIRHNDGPSNIEDWTGGTAGFSDLVGHNDRIVGAVVLNNKLVIFKERSISIGNYYSATSPFGYDEDVVSNYGLVAQNGFCLYPGGIFFLGRDPSGGFLGPCVFNLQSVQRVGALVVDQMLAEQGIEDEDDVLRYNCIHVSNKKEIWCFCYTTTYNSCWVWNYEKDFWTKYSFSTHYIQASYAGPNPASYGISGTSDESWNGGSTHDVLLGSSSGYILRYDENATLDDETVFTGYYCTKDFYLKDAKGQLVPFNLKRVLVLKLMVYANVTTPMTVSYSVDGGESYTTFASISLTTSPTVYELPADFRGYKVRFKFSGTSSGQFIIKGFSVHYLDLGVAR